MKFVPGYIRSLRSQRCYAYSYSSKWFSFSSHCVLDFPHSPVNGKLSLSGMWQNFYQFIENNEAGGSIFSLYLFTISSCLHRLRHMMFVKNCTVKLNAQINGLDRDTYVDKQDATNPIFYSVRNLVRMPM